MDALGKFCRHVVGARYESLPEPAIRATKTFVLDTIGVGVAGSRDPWAAQLIDAQQRLATGEDARLLGRFVSLPAPAAALCNGYQIHNAEFDCVHEAAVVHPMAVVLSAVLAHVDRVGGTRPIETSGRDLILAVALGVDVACHLGVACKGPLAFFRPATAGAFGATAALGKLAGFDVESMRNAMGITYSQMCGTMQAHVEGSPVLGMQMGFNARNAIVACELAATGLPAPRDVLDGPFGYFSLFEREHDLRSVLPLLGHVWRITEVAHKPYPSGRATHGIVDACLELRAEHGLEARVVAQVTARVPPLTHRLVSRPVTEEMEPSYARLSAPYVAARALLYGGLGLADFERSAMRDPATLALGACIVVAIDDNPDPNALTPVSVQIRLRSGELLARTVDVVYGNPAKPMSREAHLRKFRDNWQSAAEVLAAENAEALIDCIDRLDAIQDAREILEIVTPHNRHRAKP